MQNPVAHRPRESADVESLTVPSLVIRPPHRWAVLRLSEVWQFRELLLRFVARDVTLRYRQTALGVTWVVLQPLLAAGVFTFVFGTVARLPSEGVPYFAFSLAGMLAWNLFNGTVTKASMTLTNNTGLVSKIFFPRLILPLSTLGSTLLDFAVSGVLMIIVLVLTGIAPTGALVTLPFWILMALLTSAGIGVAAAALMVKYRDIAFVIPFATQILMYATPIAYSFDRIPPSGRIWVELNPMTGLVCGLRWSVLGTASPTTFMTCWSAVAALALFLAGTALFSRMEREFADVI